MELIQPLKFKPIFLEKIWGGTKIKTHLKYDFGNIPNCGEAWMLSAVPGYESVVAEGPLEGNTLSELVEIFMEDLVGEKVYDQFENNFPLLVKFIDASQWLSIQVHPDDSLAQKRGFERGKTEMWYVLEADENSQLISGFSKEISKKEYVERLQKKRLEEVLNFQKVKQNEVFFTPSGRIHAIGPGILLAEIQQSADLTYRIFDWDRVDSHGNPRELHVEEALDAIDFSITEDARTPYTPVHNQTIPLVSSSYFTTNLLELDTAISKNYEDLDSFVIYVVTQGSLQIHFNETQLDAAMGEVVLIPNALKNIDLYPTPAATLLEVFV
ncbi:MAG: class I mannose-6-phosphate isomerase [Bacteroidales bacterium]|nr:class I mannose-6-phosphate isomerase [Bacteroidales bacterium]